MANCKELAACSAVLPGSSNFLDFDSIAPMAEKFNYLSVDSEKLRAQLCVIREMLKQTGNGGLKTTEDILQFLLPMKSAFPDFVKFLQLVLTIPVSSAQAERSFSCLKRVKTYLRSTMSAQRLNNLCLLSIEREIAETVQNATPKILDVFLAQKNRRLNLTF